MTKERVVFILLLLILLFLRNFDTDKAIKKWNTKDTQNSYLYSGKYKLSSITQEEIDNLPSISEDNAILIMINKENIKKYRSFVFLKGIGEKKDAILKKYIILE